MLRIKIDAFVLGHVWVTEAKQIKSQYEIMNFIQYFKKKILT